MKQVLRACPKLSLLVTSRERLHLEEEHIMPLAGLPYPQGDTPSWQEATTSDAVRLFVQRAQQAAPDFDLTATTLADVLRLCRLVEGLPLGLELAARWLRVMPCADIADEIARLDLTSDARNVPERQRSLRAVFESSWQRLGTKEQEVLRQLAVFRGGFSREAAAEIAGATISLLAALVDKSLLRPLPNGR